MQLETDRLLLRPWKRSDWKAVQEYASDPEVVRFMEWGPNSIEDTEEFIDKALVDQRAKTRYIYEFAVILKNLDSDRLIGACGLRVRPYDYLQADIGYCFNRSYWGQGYATESCRCLLDLGFAQLKLHRIQATCDAQNIGSACVLKKSGMRQEAHFIKDKKIKERWRDTLLFAILNEEYEHQL